MTTSTTQAEFEAWLSTRKLCTKYAAKLDKLPDGQYRDIRVRGHYSTWQAATPDLCEWLQDEWDNSYDTSCGNKYQIIDGTPEDNGMKFCTYCGGPLVAVYSSEGEE